jgi:hypothetical protein
VTHDRADGGIAHAIRADSRPSLHPQTKLANLKKADDQGCDSVFSMCKRSERQHQALFTDFL